MNIDVSYNLAEEESKINLQVGDVVELRSGSVPMTVCRVEKASDLIHRGVEGVVPEQMYAVCVFFFKGALEETALINVKLLTPTANSSYYVAG